MPEEKTTKFCSNCGAEIDIKAKICPKCGVEQPIIPEKVSNWWYVVPILLGIIGGLVAWLVNKDRNPKKAKRFLILGIVLPIIYIIVYIGIFASIVLVSMGGAREKAKEARIMANMSQLRVTAEMIYWDTEDYSGVSCLNPQLTSICGDIKNTTEKEPTIYSAREAYCAYVKLPSGDYYCIDSGYGGIGTRGKTSAHPGEVGYCDGITFVCP